ncbi:MAG: YcxB family protein [Anaerolineales bacterium]|nr:YcxB family protein [Anaerolineales bacterium]
MSFQPITIKYNYKISDLIRAYRRYRSKTLMYKIGLALGAICLIVGIWYLVQFNLDTAAVLLFLLALMLAFDLVRLLRIWLAFKRNEKLYTKEIEVRIEDGGIHSKTDDAESFFKWERFDEVMEDEQFFLLIYGKWMYTIIPKRIFSDPTQMQIVSEMFREHVVKSE